MKAKKEREPRFPDIAWYCDQCGALLNSQDNFDDHKYIWKCTACGYKNSISSANIIDSNPYTPANTQKQQHILYVIGLLKSVCLRITLAFAISLLLENNIRRQDITAFFAFLTVAIEIGGIIYEQHLAKWKISFKNVLFVIRRNIKEGISMIIPFGSIGALFRRRRFIQKMPKELQKKERENRRFATIVSWLHIISFIGTLILFSYLIHYGFKDWGILFNTLFSKITTFINSIIH